MIMFSRVYLYNYINCYSFLKCLVSLTVPTWVIVVIVCVVIFFFAVGIIVGILLTLFCRICVHGIQQSKFVW